MLKEPGCPACTARSTSKAAAKDFRVGPWPPLVPNFYLKFHYVKKKIPITSKCWHMHGVLNVDEI
jgi:hypothetical protein